MHDRKELQDLDLCVCFNNTIKKLVFVKGRTQENILQTTGSFLTRLF